MFDFSLAFKKMRSGLDRPVTVDLLKVSSEMKSVLVTKDTLNLELLPTLSHISFVTAYNINSVSFEKICSAKQITHLSINAAGLKNVESFSNLTALEGLEVTDNTKIGSLDWVASLSSLQVFALADCPITVSLVPVGFCKELRYIWLSSSHSKPMRLDSLDGLSGLVNLENLIIKNARVADGKLSGLHNLKHLVKVELPDFFPKKEFLDLAVALPHATGYWLDQHKGTH